MTCGSPARCRHATDRVPPAPSAAGRLFGTAPSTITDGDFNYVLDPMRPVAPQRDPESELRETDGERFVALSAGSTEPPP